MFKSLFNNFNNRYIIKYSSVIDKINNLATNLKRLSDYELREQTNILKEKLLSGENLDNLLITAFAIVKEATYRILGLIMFDVQIMGGIILHEGKIAEMKTGEGKTLVSVLPTYLNALLGKGVHVITVNDYLAKRDAQWVGRIHTFLGLSVGLIQPNMNYSERRENYNCDVTYVTNSQLGFDYLKDNMAISQNEIVQRSFFFGIIDEVDSILIDEARTPLIISGPSESSTKKYLISAQLSQFMEKNIHYEVDVKNKNVTFIDTGIVFCEQYLNLNDLYNIENPWAQYILNSLRAKELFIKNVHYIIQNDKVVIVDEFTGRIMEDRRWSDGLHQAIEAKEDMTIQKENKTLASITYQNFFLLYPKLAGMTGTAKTEETELDKTYQLQVLVIPTNRPCIRQDLSDLVYRDEYNKWKAIANECANMYEIGRPILVGTSSIKKSELLANLLNEYSIPYNLLNAKPENIKRESEIISQAGRKFSLTIATNMAGRGTDIILGGNLEDFIISCLIYYLNKKFNIDTSYPNQYNYENLSSNAFLILRSLSKHYGYYINISKLSIHSLEKNILEAIKKKQPINMADRLLKDAYQAIQYEYQPILRTEKEEVIRLGGLHVIGTERHESRRIDNQLRGRAGRQGDPGSSRFFLSLEDNLLKVFGGDSINKIMKILKLEDNTPIESGLINKSLDSAQKKVESYFYNIRKQLLEYDEVLSDQRQAIYSERNRILKSSNCRDSIIEYAEMTIDELLKKYAVSYQEFNNPLSVLEIVSSILNITNKFDLYDYNQLTREQIRNLFYEQTHISYDLQEIYLNKTEPDLVRELEKYYLLQQIDNGWQKHLEHMACLRESIGLRGYAQQDPLIEYKRAAFSLFILMISYVRQTVVFLMFNTK